MDVRELEDTQYALLGVLRARRKKLVTSAKSHSCFGRVRLGNDARSGFRNDSDGVL